MSLLVILAIGAILGWLAGLITRAPGGHGMGAIIALGVAGALISGAMASDTALLEGITVESIGGTLIGTLVLLAGVNILWRHPPPAVAPAPSRPMRQTR